MGWTRCGWRARPTGFTLFEVTVALGFLGVFLAASVPRFLDVRDRIAVRSAREATIGLLARARYHAVVRGGAEVRASEGLQLLELSSSAGLVEVYDLDSSHGVQLDIRGSSRTVTLRYDRLGLGRFTSRTLELRRGEAVARIVLSTYGRVRRG